MVPMKSRSSADVKIKLTKVLQRATNEILSKLNNLKKIKSYEKQSSIMEFNSFDWNCTHLQKSSSLPEWDSSGRAKLSIKAEEDLIYGSNCEKYFSSTNLVNVFKKENKKIVVKSPCKTGFIDRNSLVTENSIVKHIDDQNSSKIIKDEYQRQTQEKFRPTFNVDVCKYYRNNHNSQLFSKILHNNNCSELNLAQTSLKINLPAEESLPGIWHKGKKNLVPPKTAAVGKTRTDIPVYVGRVYFKGNIIPAPVVPAKGVAYFSWNGKVFSTDNFEILEIHKFAWKDEGSALESPVAFQVGQTAKGEPMYLGRVYIEGMGPWVGRVHDDERRIYIVFRGNELCVPQPYQVFVAY